MLQAGYQHLGFEKGDERIKTYWVKSDAFGFHWHYHPEIEITCVRRGRGSRLVGDNISSFHDGDFVMIGSHLPHTWISDDDFNASTDTMEVAVLQFLPDVIPGEMLRMPEMNRINRVLRSISRGIDFHGESRPDLTELMFDLVEAEGFEKFRLFVTLLDRLGQEDEFTQLASVAYSAPRNDSSENRLQQVCAYIHDNFTETIRLDDIATIANLNASSFCRFFKKSTGQTFSEYVTDLRIGKATNLLLAESTMSVSEIAFKCGFNSQTLFNRAFKRSRGTTPLAYRKNALGRRLAV